jgi:hypothetical protein
MDRAELKELARQRREKKLIDMQDGLMFGDRIIPSGKEYRRNLKHKPRSAYDWEELEDEWQL